MPQGKKDAPVSEPIYIVPILKIFFALDSDKRWKWEQPDEQLLSTAI